MVKLLETEIFSDDCPDSVVYGDIITLGGKPLKISKIIQRRWGWTGKAARLAEDVLLGDGINETPLELAEPLNQQLHLFAVEPEILSALVQGIRLSSSKNAYDAHRTLYGVSIKFSESVKDDGLVSTIIKALGGRFGVSADDVRAASDFTNEYGNLKIDVDNYAHDLS